MSTLARPTAADLRETVRLALPVIVVQVGLMLMGVVDTLMVGRVSAAALAAVAVGNLYFFVVTIFGMGVLLALDPIVSQAVGAGDAGAVRRAVQRGLVLSAVMSVVVSLGLLGAGPVQVPAAGVSGVERTLWLMDRDAAAELPADLQQRGRI